MKPAGDILIRVHTAWNSWRNAEVRLADLEDVHWAQPKGSTHEFVHGYIRCTQVASGEIPHDCRRDSLPHRLAVCVLKRHATSATYAMLAQLADKQRAEDLHQGPAASVSPREAG
jgi:hypothetical protein